MWAQTVVVENRGGAGHTFATTAVKAATADGYTLLASETGFVTSQPHLYSKGKLSFEPADFVPIAGYAGIPMGLLTHPSVPAKTVAELIALAKEKPGALTYGTAGLGSALHTGALLLESLAGIKLTAVHYRGAAPALNDLIAGHINMITMGPSIALPAVQAGKINMLGFGSVRRVPQLPDVPTIAETVPGYEATVSFGLFAVAGTPREIVAKINADVQTVIGEPEFHKRYLEPLVVQPLPGSQAAFAEYIRQESAKWSKVISDAKLKIE
jgi:tripartite-type tricarboxylate transporter receptor subunit TctC